MSVCCTNLTVLCMGGEPPTELRGAFDTAHGSSCATLSMLPTPHTMHAQVDELFTEQAKRGLKTPCHLVLVPPAGFKLESFDARGSGLQRT